MSWVIASDRQEPMLDAFVRDVSRRARQEAELTRAPARARAVERNGRLGVCLP
ncbi:hypothetical protein [Paracoccus shandongensis]|uniref:hypothetical protein n=1 Tax=Paracoccus shandongensis TaxID=2816048 RepID=UPI001A9044E6|nr:hypothetical protein [Paracoccus shandongensis]